MKRSGSKGSKKESGIKKLNPVAQAAYKAMKVEKKPTKKGKK